MKTTRDDQATLEKHIRQSSVWLSESVRAGTSNRAPYASLRPMCMRVSSDSKDFMKQRVNKAFQLQSWGCHIQVQHCIGLKPVPNLRAKAERLFRKQWHRQAQRYSDSKGLMGIVCEQQRNLFATTMHTLTSFPQGAILILTKIEYKTLLMCKYVPHVG